MGARMRGRPHTGCMTALDVDADSASIQTDDIWLPPCYVIFLALLVLLLYRVMTLILFVLHAVDL
jgi:hypothetical protein